MSKSTAEVVGSTAEGGGMRCRFSCSFEYAMRPPQTHRGIVEGGRAQTCVTRAVKESQKVLKPVGWSSMVVVLLDRLDLPAGDDATGTVDADGPESV